VRNGLANHVEGVRTRANHTTLQPQTSQHVSVCHAFQGMSQPLQWASAVSLSRNAKSQCRHSCQQTHSLTQASAVCRDYSLHALIMLASWDVPTRLRILASDN
jgi:hypothetical protein